VYWSFIHSFIHSSQVSLTWHCALQVLGYCFLVTASQTGSHVSSHQQKAFQVVLPRVLLALILKTLASRAGANTMPPPLVMGTPATT
jgi:hypothetical protein